MWILLFSIFWLEHHEKTQRKKKSLEMIVKNNSDNLVNWHNNLWNKKYFIWIFIQSNLYAAFILIKYIILLLCSTSNKACLVSMQTLSLQCCKHNLNVILYLCIYLLNVTSSLHTRYDNISLAHYPHADNQNHWRSNSFWSDHLSQPMYTKHNWFLNRRVIMCISDGSEHIAYISK